LTLRLARPEKRSGHGASGPFPEPFPWLTCLKIGGSVVPLAGPAGLRGEAAMLRVRGLGQSFFDVLGDI
jgi:hypothetical protein